MLNTESLGKNQITYMKHIKIWSCQMGVIFTPKHMIWKRKIYVYPQSDHALTHWKCVMKYCAKCLSVNLPDQETDDQYSDTSPEIRFHHIQ